MQCVTYGSRVLRTWPLQQAQGGTASQQGRSRVGSQAGAQQAADASCNYAGLSPRPSTATRLCAAAAKAAACCTAGRAKKREPLTSTPCTKTGLCKGVQDGAGSEVHRQTWEERLASTPCTGTGPCTGGGSGAAVGLDKQSCSSDCSGGGDSGGSGGGGSPSKRSAPHLLAGVRPGLREHVGLQPLPGGSSHVVQHAACGRKRWMLVIKS